MSMLSEDEAKQYWCPFTRVAVDGREYMEGVASANRDTGIETQKHTLCIGSQCMAWRWAGWLNRISQMVAQAPAPEDRVGERLGFCGLAGRPL
jgi:hypothetical protein